MKNYTQNLFFVALIFFGTTIYSQDSSYDDSMDLEELEEIVLIGGGVIDLAEDRVTPVASSTIKSEEIQKKVGNLDITNVLLNTPSVYVSSQGRGFGDTRISIRGFDQTNTAFMLNGQPINGMEDGKMYWSNWSGMSDIANAIQVQRGLGASKLAISSVGGTVNFVMKSASKSQGGFISQGMANDNYLKSTVSYDTGMNENGWATSFLLSHWQGDGYMDGTKGAGQNYFLSIGYKMNEKHSFNFLMTGAPQYHDNADDPLTIDEYLLRGRKHNENWGYYGDQYKSLRTNFYHKPVFNLNWDYNINDKSSLSTVLYASTGNGGGTGPRGYTRRTDEGLIDWDTLYANNAALADGAGYQNVAGPDFEYGEGYVIRASTNNHMWVGAVSNYETQLNENLSLNVGFDFRHYQGEHYRMVVDFMGLSSWTENVRLKDPANNFQSYGDYGQYKSVYITESVRARPWQATFNKVARDQRLAWDYEETIVYGGLFTQLEYTKDKLSAFFQGSISNQSHQRFDYYQYADQALIDGTSSQSAEPIPAGITDGVDSEKVDNMGFNAKVGFGYEVYDNAKVYVNAGYYSRQPYHDNIYLNYGNQLNPYDNNETILGLEAGYSYSVPNLTANINVYRTNWADRVTTRSRLVDDQVEFTVSEGVEQLHQGIEVDFVAQPQPEVPYTVRGFVSVGDWKYQNQAFSRTYNEDRELLEESSNDVDGGDVGDAAQFTAGIGLDIELAERLSVDGDVRFYDNLFADVGPTANNLELPNYQLMDLGLSYKMLLDSGSLDIRLNLNNVFDKVYIGELRTAVVAGDEDATGVLYNGIDTGNEGFFGLGRTWNLSLRYNF